MSFNITQVQDSPELADTGATAPTKAAQIGATDGTNLQAVKAVDLDTGAGTDFGLAVSVRLPGSGGSVAGGTSANPIRIDPTGTTTQPVSGTVAVSGTVPVSAASLPLPTGAATETTLAAINTKTPSLGQTTMSASQPVVIASNQSAIPVSGTVTATNPSVGTNNSAIPASSTQIGGSDGTNIQAAKTFDLDTGAGTDFNLGISLRLPASGGSVVGGTSSNPLRTDPTGTTTQPVSGTVAISGTVPVSAASLPLPTGAATETTLSSLNTKVPSQGQAAMAASLPVVIASNQSAVPVSGTVAISGTVPVSGTVTANIGTTNGLALDATLTGGTAKAQVGGLGADAAALTGNPVRVGGSDGTNLRTLRTATDGTVRVDPTGTTTQPVSGTVAISGTVPVSAASLPLPTGAATETTLSSINTKTPALGQTTMAGSQPVTIASNQSAVPVSGTVTANIGTTNGLALDATLTGGTAQAIARGAAKGATAANAVTVTIIDADHNALDVSVRGTAAISAASLPLPTGAATETTLAAINTKTAALGQTTMTGSSPVVIASNQSAIPVSGTVAISGTVPVSAASLPLPTGAATETTLSALNTKVPSQGQALMAASQPVVIASNQSAVPVSGTVTSNIGTTNGLALDATLTGGTQKAIVRGGAKGATAASDVTSTSIDANHQGIDITDGGGSITVDGTVAISGTVPVSAASLPLPTGAATETTLAAINTKMPALGQTTMSGSQPVTIASNQSSIPVSQATASNLNAQVVGAAATGAAVAGNPVLVAGSDGTLVRALLTDANSRLVISGASSTAGTPLGGIITIQGIVSGTAVAVSAASLPLPTGAATETTLSALNTKVPSQGQALMAASQPVVIASNQSAIPVSGTVTATNPSVGTTGTAVPVSATQIGGSDGTNLRAIRTASDGTVRVDPTGTTTQPVSGTVAISGTVPISAASLPLPTGAATETTLAAINTKAPALGQAVMSASVPVVLASNQSAITIDDGGGSLTVDGTVGVVGQAAEAVAASGNPVRIGGWDGTLMRTIKTATDGTVRVDPTGTTTQPVSVASLPLPSGAATEATLSALNTKVPSQGQAAMTASVPVVIASNQSNLPVQGPAAEAAAASGNPVRLAGWDGTNIRTIKTDSLGRLVPYEENTFTLFASAVVPGNLKSMIALFNGGASTKTLKLREVHILNTATISLVGVALSFEMRKLTALSSGTAITPDRHDSTDPALDAAVVANTNGTFTETGGLLRRWIWSSDEWGPGTADQEGFEHTIQNAGPAWKVHDIETKPFVLNAGQGIHIKCATNTTAGLFDLVFVFTQV